MGRDAVQTNEELVKKIREGEQGLMLELWQQNRGIIAANAYRVLHALRDIGRNSVELDDLMQSGYLGLVEAVERYDLSGDAKFTTMLNMTLKKAFADATGYRTERTKREPLHCADSLDRPAGSGEDDQPIGELVVDRRDGIAEVEGRIYREQLHEALEAALSDLPADQERVLRLRYYQGKGYKEVEEELCLSPHKCRSLEFSGLSTLRQGQGKAARLYEFMEDRTNYFARANVERQESAVEKIVLRREYLRERFNLCHK
jgi:RNA polymerase sigma factor (sigma-70 family)